MDMMLEAAPETRPERLRYFPRQLIGADDLAQEQQYLLERFRRHNRLLHGWGVACGCDVQPSPETGKPWQVTICPGYILTPQGDEISIGANVKFDVATCLIQTTDPCAYARPCPPISRQAQQATKVFLAVRYVESASRPVRVAPVGCSCGDASCEFSRVRECYEFCCLDKIPSTYTSGPQYSCLPLCRGGVVPCTDKPEDPWVLLAGITLPENSVGPLSVSTYGRPILFSTAMLQVCACTGNTKVADDPRTFLQPEPVTELSTAPAPGITTPTVATPTITPPSGSYNFTPPGPITISATTAGATIYYTTDGSEPTASSNVYQGPFPADNPPNKPTLYVVKARAFVGAVSGDVTTAAYDIRWPSF